MSNWVKGSDHKDANVFEEIELSTALMIKLADALSLRFDQGCEQNDLDVAIHLYREVLKRRPLAYTRSHCLINLANALKIRLDEGGRQHDLDEAVPLFRKALQLPLFRPYYRPVLLNNLASVLLTKFKQRGQKADVDEAISLYRQALKSFRPFDPERVVPINNLAAALVARSEHGGQRKDFDEAISLHKQALGLRLPPHPERCDSLYNLADAMFTRFKFDGEIQSVDLDEAISVHRQALELRSPPHSKRSDSLINLAVAVSLRFDQRGQQSDIDEVISLRRQVLELQPSPHPDRYRSLASLATELVTRVKQTGKITDLDEALCLHREALELLPQLHPERSTCLGNVANTLSTRFEQGGQETDLDQAISMYRQALQLRPSPHTGRSDTIHNIAAELAIRFEHGGRLVDLDEAISLQREILELQPSLHPDRYMSLGNLASSLGARFMQTGQKIDLDEAIFLDKKALELVPPPHPHKALYLNNLANELMRRFEQGGQKADLDDAISMHKQALQLRLPPHPDRSISLSNLAAVLFRRAELEGHQIDLDEAIRLNREALQLRPLPHPDRYMSLTNLASGLSARFRKIGQRTDIDEAISLTRQALGLQSPHHSGRSNIYTALGKFLIYAHHDDPDSLENALSSFAAATQCPSQSPSSRLRAAKTWIYFADKYQHISAIDAYGVALQILPQVAALSFDVQSRQEALTAGSDGLARNAARCAIRSGNLGRAIEFLEAGRSIFWSQVLSLRSSIDQISKIAPLLADNLRDIAIALELGSHRDRSSEISNNLKKLSLDQDAFRLNRLNEKWEKAIDDARNLEGFEDFLRPARLSSLQSAASDHPIVLLVANDDGSHCLIMTLTCIHHIPLTVLRTDVLEGLVYLVQVAAGQIQISRSAIEKTQRNVLEHLREQRGLRVKDDLGSSDDIFRFVLRILWKLIVKPIISFLDFKKLGEMAILQWCPTGAFTFLPIHAAGCYHDYGDQVAIESASDYFISTYIPTIGTLLAHRSAPSAQNFKMMAIVQSAELPSTKKELEHIQKHVPSTSLIKFGVPGADASVEAVASRLPDASIVHFACHGKQDHTKPLNSGLTLQDGLLKISRIMKEKIPSGTLAFLCACETAMGDHKLPDEAMSLGASFLFSGFHRVVATMW
ncbi:hypothetical protein GALMADRAFT_234945 [Galerina marginata CBS 339.88]|uniref:CHAT domain-containing protein n=1 Tax=Galerina marginata (strain CBS 339.88) TaxID=685588 RepID=A0A067TRI9_GALM3|nr:hypothetical protein GALMADRAFT_234945 [Galerina marginata CBS 339.88]